MTVLLCLLAAIGGVGGSAYWAGYQHGQMNAQAERDAEWDREHGITGDGGLTGALLSPCCS